MPLSSPASTPLKCAAGLPKSVAPQGRGSFSHGDSTVSHVASAVAESLLPESFRPESESSSSESSLLQSSPFVLASATGEGSECSRFERDFRTRSGRSERARAATRRAGGPGREDVVVKPGGHVDRVRPIRHAFLSSRRTRPSGLRLTFSWAMGGRSTYLRRASRPRASCPPARVGSCSVKPPMPTDSSRWYSFAPFTAENAPRRNAGPAGGLV